jgi:hypothetical protein
MHPAVDDPRSLSHWADDQLTPGMDGNETCTACHTEYQEPQALARHSHHRTDSAGSSCMNCHMPNTSYGLLKGTRSHEIHSPSVSATLATGRPNACNLCHLDKSLGWAATTLTEWYGIPGPSELSESRGLSRDEQGIAASILWLLSGDAGQRALTAWALSWEHAREASGTEWMPPLLAHLLEDPYDAVRFIAARTLAHDELFADLDYDFLAPPHERRAAKQSVLRKWSAAELNLRDDPALLLEGGTLNAEAVARLLSNRDDRPVRLTE